jgi:AcrR family transcriptional regulator
MATEEHAKIDLRRVQGAASRERLLQAATELFAERGVAATGVETICRRAGVVKSALYWHFRNKQRLVAAVVERAGDRWVEEIRSSVAEAGDPTERLDRFVAGLRSLAEKHPELLRLLLAAILESEEGGVEAQEAVRSVFVRSSEAITKELYHDFGDRLANPERVVFLSIGLLVAITLRAMLLPNDTDLDELFSDLRRTVARELIHQTRIGDL